MRDLERFAADVGVDLVAADALAALQTGDFRSDPSVDYGRVIRRTPSALLRPNDRSQLAACMRFLFGAGVPHAIRAAGHSSGGQALIEGGAVIDTSRLARILTEDDDTVTVEGGAWWIALVQHLAPRGKRPMSITANLRTSIAGTLAVGGFGDSAHLHGLQINHVARMTVVLPGGEVRALGPDDELFGYVLAGRGQLGAIADVTLRTQQRPWTMHGRIVRWPSLAAFVREDLGAFDFVRTRLRAGGEVTGHLGAPAPGGILAHADHQTPDEVIDLYALLSRERPDELHLGCPALEIVLPLPGALEAWRELWPMVVAAGLPALQLDGHSVMIVDRDPRLPLAPLPAPRSMMIALRPKLPVVTAPALLPELQAIGVRALELGGRLYLMSIPVAAPDFLARQFGDALARFTALKDDLDPRRLLNPGLI